MAFLAAYYSGCDCGSCERCLGASGVPPRRRRTTAVPESVSEHLEELATAARAYAVDCREVFEATLKMLVEHPSVTPGGGHDDDCLGLAVDALAFFQSLGFEAWLQETGGNPCIVGRCAPPGGPAELNIMVYNHMDVVPAILEDGWTRDPFTFTREGDKYYGRGTTDDKGPALTALYGVLAAQRAGLPVDVSFVWELEEEIGSPNFAAGLRGLLPHLPPRIDMCICSDTLWVSDGLPTVVEMVRGSISFDISLDTAEGDVHSGICGGVARNPLNELIALGASIVGKDGVPKLPAMQLPPVISGPDLIDNLGEGWVTADSFRKDFALRSMRTDDPALILQRSWAEPCVEIVGLSGGYGGVGVKTAIPARASLKINVRLVGSQDPDEIEREVRSFVAENVPDAEVSVMGKMKAFDGRLAPEHKVALKRAYQLGFGQVPGFGCVGGSIGVLPTLQSVLGVPILLPSLSSPSQSYHGKNENYCWQRFEDGVVMYVVLLADLIADASSRGRQAGFTTAATKSLPWFWPGARRHSSCSSWSSSS